MEPGRARNRPPRLARAIVALIVPPGPARDGLVGDLEEMYAERRSEGGRLQSGSWYVWEALNATARYAFDRVRRRARGFRPRRVTRGSVLESTIRDLRYAYRALRRRPGFALTAILTLALGIGGTTAIFAVVDTVLLRDLPYAEPGRLVNVWTTYPYWRGRESLDAHWDRISLSYPEYEDWRDGTRLFSGTAAYTQGPVALTGNGVAEQLTAGVATASLLEVLGVRPALGRWFLPGEDVEGRPVVVLGDGLWRRRFGADPAVLGRTVTINDATFTVIGVMPRGFALKNVFVEGDTGIRDAWLPLAIAGDLNERGNHAYDVLGRLMPGASLEAALAEATPILRGDASPERRGVRLAMRREVEVGRLRSPLLLLLAASGVLLMIACGNVATMLLGESLGRRPEMATRAALGAGRRRIIRQLLTESVLLGLAGAVAGGLLALVLTKLIVVFGPMLPIAREITVSPRVLLFASGLGLATGGMFGIAPVAAIRHVGLREAMQRGVSGWGRRDRGLQSGVVVLEIALTTVLLVGGGLLTRTLLNLFRVDPGFRTDGIAVIEVSASAPRFTPERVSLAFAGALEKMAAVPGVARVSGVNTLPLEGGSSSTSLDIEGLPPASGDDPGPEAQRRVVFPGYHTVMGIPLLAGRLLDETDGPDGPLVMLISERFARMYWPNGSPLGARIRYDRRWWTVVGVVGDVRHDGLDAEPVATYYIPHAQDPFRTMTFVARTTTEPRAVLQALRDAVWSADPDVIIPETHTMASLLSRASAGQRQRATIVMVFAVMAASLAAVGIFGVTARSVARRGPEMGVRMALGARVPVLTGRVVGGSFLTGLAGIALGAAGAAWAARWLSAFLFEVNASDPATYVTVAGSVLLVTVLASYLAARRIASVNPVDVLKAE